MGTNKRSNKASPKKEETKKVTTASTKDNKGNELLKSPDARLFSFFKIAMVVGSVIIVVLLVLVAISGMRVYGYEKSQLEENLVNPLLRIEAAFAQVDAEQNREGGSFASAQTIYTAEASYIIQENISLISEQLAQGELGMLLYRKNYKNLETFMTTLEEDMYSINGGDAIVRQSGSISQLAGDYAAYYSGEGSLPASAYVGLEEEPIE